MLTPKQAAFVSQFLIDLNATRAAIRAGYSPRHANRAGHALLANAEVRAAIDEAKVARSERLRVDADLVLQRLFEEAEADLADIFNERSDLKPIREWPLIWRKGLVAGVEVEELFEGFGEDRVQVGHVRKIKLSDRIRRLELIGKHVGVNAFKDVVEHQGLAGLADRLARAHQRGGEGESRAQRRDADAGTVITLEAAEPLPALPQPAPQPLPVEPADDGASPQASPPPLTKQPARAPDAYRPILPPFPPS